MRSGKNLPGCPDSASPCTPSSPCSSVAASYAQPDQTACSAPLAVTAPHDPLGWTASCSTRG